MNKVFEVKPKTSRDNISHLLFDADAKLSKALQSRRKLDGKKQSEETILTTSEKQVKKLTSPNEIFKNDVEQVQKLQDFIYVPSERSNFAERFLENRRNNHEAIVNQLLADLDYLGGETKDGLEFVSQHLITNLNDNHYEIDHAMQSLKCTEMFQSESQIKDLWTWIDEKYEENSIWIQEFFVTLCKQEHLKMTKVQELIRNAYTKLRAISFMTPDELQIQLFEYAMDLQKTSLSNKDRFSELQWTLSITDETLKISQFITWNKFWHDWLQNLATSAVEQFTLVLPAIASGKYGYISRMINKFNNECDSLVNKRVMLLLNVRNVKPPNCRESAQKWTDSLLNLNEEHEITCVNFGDMITMQDPQLLTQLNEEMYNIKKSLLQREICSQSIIDDILNEKQLNFMNDHLLDLNLTIERVKKDKVYQRDGLDALEQTTISALMDLVEIWEKHQTEILVLMKSVEIKLEEICLQMSEKCDNEETHLTIFLDNMRAEISKEVLEKYFNFAMESLTNIKTYYFQHHSKRIEVLKFLPPLITNEVNRYRADLKEFFGPAAGYLLNPVTSKLNDVTIKVTSDSDPQTKTENSETTETTNKSKNDKKSWHSIDLTQYYLPSYLTGTYSSVNLQSFMTVTLPQQSSSAAEFVKYPPSDTAWIGCETCFQYLLRILCVNFAAHWEQWAMHTNKQAGSIKEIKTIELKNELELRLKLHESRIHRIRSDIFDLRLKELISHSEQVARHVNTLSKDIDVLSTKIEIFKNEQVEILNQLRNKMTNMDEQMINMTTVNGVIDHRKKMEETVSEEVNKNKNIISKYQDEIVAAIAAFHESNINLTKSFKNFFNNGNYSNDEIILLTNQIMKLSPSLQSVEFYASKTLDDLQNAWSSENDLLKKSISTNWDGAEIDMDFIERINRSFSNVQVKIKCDVKAMNTLSHSLQKNMDTIHDLLHRDADEAIYVYFTIVKELSLRAVQLGIIAPIESVPKVATGIVNALFKDKKGSSMTSHLKIPMEFQLFAGEQIENETDFLGIIKNLLWKLQNELFLAAETFYHKRTDRLPRFPLLIPTNYDYCCRDVTTKIRNYWNQTKDYHSQSMKEFFAQVDRIKSISIRFVPSVAIALKKRYLNFIRERITFLRIDINKVLVEWEVKKNSLANRLRPQLGFPTQSAKLQQLIDDVKSETDSHITQWTQYYKDLKNIVKDNGIAFLEVLNELTENLLKNMDYLITEKDLIFVKSHLDTSNLPHLGIVPELFGKYKPLGIWPGFRDCFGDDEIKLSKPFNIKQNFAQEHLLSFRGIVFKDFGEEFFKICNELEIENDKHIREVNQWQEIFLLSINNLKQVVDTN